MVGISGGGGGGGGVRGKRRGREGGKKKSNKKSGEGKGGKRRCAIQEVECLLARSEMQDSAHRANK